MEEAQLLAQLSLANGLPYEPQRDEPQRDGFVFSTAEINRAIDRGNRLESARDATRHQFRAAAPPELRYAARQFWYSNEGWLYLPRALAALPFPALPPFSCSISTVFQSDLH
jgi:hypothetical protein